MWLLDANDVSLKWIANRDLESQDGSGQPPRYRYGILSHRWGEDHEEATFEEYRANQPSHTKKGTLKIREFCRVARSHGLDLVWADTCCIDKRSSAELQEAINSMYRYYQQAAICFTYLRDISVDNFATDFANSEWFTRGWTLQELLAPIDLRFYDRDWKFIGDKNTLSPLISRITGIPVALLVGDTGLQHYSAAHKLSWAAKRQTSCIEDRAYSLLGIFDVNLTMLYGEGPKAFLRLQEEIIKTCDDPSLFVWEDIQYGYPGLLATSPDAFASCADVAKIRTRRRGSSYVVNNRGLRGEFSLIPYTLDTYLTLLPCASQQAGEVSRIGIFLRQLYEEDQFMRVPVDGENLMKDGDGWLARRGGWKLSGGFEREISIRQRPLSHPEQVDMYKSRIQGFLVDSTDGSFAGQRPFEVSGEWDATTRVLSLSSGHGNIHLLGSINIAEQHKEIEVIRLGFDRDYYPVVYASTRAVEHQVHANIDNGVVTQTFVSRDGGRESFASDGTGSLKYHNRQARAVESTKVKGLWALRADRVDGLTTILHRGFDRVGRIKLSRTESRGRIVWMLQLKDLMPRSN